MEKSAYKEIVSLSLLMSKNLKLKKVIKSFVPEPISCFRIPIYACEHYEHFMHVNILVIFLDLNSCNFKDEPPQ